MVTQKGKIAFQKASTQHITTTLIYKAFASTYLIIRKIILNWIRRGYEAKPENTRVSSYTLVSNYRKEYVYNSSGLDTLAI